MLHKYIELIYNKLNDHLTSNFKKENILKITNNIELYNFINNKSVSKKKDLENSILLNICKIKLEEIGLNNHYYEQVGNSYIQRKKPLSFNIYIYFHSTFYDENYMEGLTYLSSIISYFHTNSTFNNENTTEIIQNNMSEFSINIINDEADKFYDSLKIPYMPSFLTKIGLISISSEDNHDITYAGVKNF